MGDVAAQAPGGDPAGSSSGGQTLYRARAIRDLYPGLREDRLRYLERWGVIRPASISGGERFYAFADLAALRHASAELARGVPFRSVVRDLRTMRQRQLAEAPGAQLSFDFQSTRETAPAKVIALTVRPVSPAPVDPLAPLVADASGAAPADAPRRSAAAGPRRRLLRRGRVARHRRSAARRGRDGRLPAGRVARSGDDRGARQPRQHPLRARSRDRGRSALRKGADDRSVQLRGAVPTSATCSTIPGGSRRRRAATAAPWRSTRATPTRTSTWP